MKKIALLALVLGVAVVSGCSSSCNTGACAPTTDCNTGNCGGAVAYQVGSGYASGGDVYYGNAGEVIAHDASAVYHGVGNVVGGAVHSVENAVEHIF